MFGSAASAAPWYNILARLKPHFHQAVIPECFYRKSRGKMLGSRIRENDGDIVAHVYWWLGVVVVNHAAPPTPAR